MNKIEVRHPCYNPDLIDKVGRIHIPVAPKCNIQCNYCNRNYSPALTKIDLVYVLNLLSLKIYMLILKPLIDKNPETEVIGIAGPAEALADLNILNKALSILKNDFPNMSICLSTNGLVLADNMSLLKQYNISFLTITINSFELKTLEKIYDWGSV